jgi:lipoprotein-anchoring transpeptidase ErfK/SrfK
MYEIRVLLGAQRLELLKDGRVAAQYIVSTSGNGHGELEGSKMTPRGRHEIAEKIGGGEPKCAVFMERKATGEICTPEFVETQPGRDWILSRILWLNGMEEGRNKGGLVDTKHRYIYIHGTHEENRIGQPVSHGCIRMLNDDVIELFELVDVGTPVEIVE